MDILAAIGPIWKVLLVGLLLGAGLPAIFAVGVRSLSAGATGADTPVRRRPAGVAGAVICFLVVVLAVAFGIAVIIGGKSFLGLFGWS